MGNSPFKEIQELDASYYECKDLISTYPTDRQSLVNKWVANEITSNIIGVWAHTDDLGETWTDKIHIDIIDEQIRIRVLDDGVLDSILLVIQPVDENTIQTKIAGKSNKYYYLTYLPESDELSFLIQELNDDESIKEEKEIIHYRYAEPPADSTTTSEATPEALFIRRYE